MYAWKRTEREIAKRLHGTRIGNTGAANPDVITEWCRVEVKHRKQLPEWLKGALDQARGGSADNRLAIAVLHESGMRHTDDLVLLRLADFEDWFGSPLLSNE